MRKYAALCAALAIAATTSGCLTRAQVRAYTWLNNAPLPAAWCGPKPAQPDAAHPTLWDYGFFRRLNTGALEFISFCAPGAGDMIGMTSHDVDLLLGQLPAGSGGK